MHPDHDRLLADFRYRCDDVTDIFAHLPRLCLEAWKAGGRTLDLGIRGGNSTCAFLLAAAKAGGHVISVDKVAPQTPDWWRDTGLWSVLLNDDLAIVDVIPDGFDALFIDTSHTYEHTLAELRAFVPKVRPGGVVMLHDTELETPDGRCPVREAVDAYAAEHGHEVEYVPDCFGLGVFHAR